MKLPYATEDVDELFRLIGEAVWHLQHLENILSSYMVYKKLQTQREKGVKIDLNYFERVQIKERKKTLGPLIKSAKKEKVIPEKLVSSFEKYLDERNWLIHKCVINEYLSLRNNDAKQALFKKITTFTNNSIEYQNEIHSLFEQWYEKKGYSLESAYELAIKQLKDAEKS